MKFCILFIFIIISSLVFSQDLYIKDNPYDNADKYNLNKNAFKRERWFYEQRMYPFNFIPENAYEKAYNQKMYLKEKSGYYFDRSVVWSNIGPTPGNLFSNGNISSRIATVKYDPNNPEIIYIGGAFGGLWKSTNGGQNWSAKTDFEISLSSGALAIDGTQTPSVVYYGTGEATYSSVSYYGRGLLKSTNGGETWTNYRNGLPVSTYFSRLIVRPNHNNELLAALGTSGIYRSSDSGVNWYQVRSGKCDDVLFSLTGDTAYAIGSGQSMRISYDGGVTFPDVIGNGITFGNRHHFSYCKNYPNIFYAAVYYSTGTVSVYKSMNKGLNFTQLVPGYELTGGQAWYDFHMYVNPFNPDYAYVGTIYVYRTTNGGVNFQNNSSSGVHVDQHNMDFHPTDSNKLLCVNDGGIWKSDNRGATYTNLNTNLTLTQFYRMTSDPSNPSHLLGGTQDNGTQRTTGTMNWTGVQSGDGGEVCFRKTDSRYIIGEYQENGIFRSTNGGMSWVGGINGLTGTGAWVGPIISHPDSAGIFYTARQQVFRTTNNAANWTVISTGTSGTIREMAICKSSPASMYASIGSVLYYSSDRGYNFSQVSNGMPNRTITSVNFHPDSSKVAIVTFSGFGAGKIYKTTNEGVNWIDISGNLPDTPINDALIYHPGYSTSIYLAATDVGVFMTNNYGANWIELANGLPNTVAMHLDYNEASGKIRLGTHGRGTWEIIGTIAGMSGNNYNVPNNYTLFQNYPNPFNPNTKIEFKIKEKGFVTIKVYSNLGKEISTLVNNNYSAGTYDLTFYGKNYSSGLYFYSLFVNGIKIDTKKMLLIK
ncbi:MAG: T9SS type A sorting domain-containing protein [Ignavibacteriae bacterium]|nr:T9SS type A sorting domain-containing protein [Ignavibacteriota bacterium]